MTVEVENKIDKPETVVTSDIAQTQNTSQQAQTAPNISPENDINWRKFREDRERERKAAEEAMRKAAEKEAEAQALKAAMEAILNKPNTNNQGYNDGYEEETEEQKIDKRVKALLAERESEAERKRAEKEASETPQRLQQTFGDFNQVCNTDNLDYLEYHYPEIATPFKYMPESFEKWASIYKAVKRFVPNTDTRKDVKKAEINNLKPQSLSSAGMAQSANAMPAARLDEQRKAENWARMQRTLKGLN